MSAAYDLTINLISAAIGAIAGVAWAYGARRLKYRHHRAFWRFLEEPTIFVVGTLEPSVLLGTLADALKETVIDQHVRQLVVDKVVGHVSTQEISGLIGRGDSDAIIKLVAKFASLGLPSEPNVLHPTQVHEQRNKNIVLIGGEDSNSLTSVLVSQLGCHLEALINKDGHNVIRDSRLDVDYAATRQSEPGANGEIVCMDYGLLVRTRNPYDLEREVVWIAGAHGLGTLAAAEVCVNSKFGKRLHGELKQYHGRFECLVSYRRIEGGPSDGHVVIDLEFCRGLDALPA